MNRIAKFNIGDIVLHTHQNYRAVVIDVDPIFQASGRYNPQALKRTFSQRNPWYRLLVDGCSLITYVEEPLLTHDDNRCTINNPNINHYLTQQSNGYISNTRIH